MTSKRPLAAVLPRTCGQTQVPNEVGRMWKWFNCYLSGRHNFGISCEPGAIFLKCSQCGRRSPGWSVDQKTQPPVARPPVQQTAARITSNATKRRVLPLSGVAAS